MTLVSYAQNHEDVLLDRLFPRGVPGFYIDVGAHDPVYNSVTKHFYDLGWHGINVEPALEPFQRLDAMRDRDVNLNVGLSDHDGTLTLHEGPPELGVSTFSGDQAQRHQEAGMAFTQRTVQVSTLASICEKYVDRPIDFLSIDVEGHELEVLNGGDWDRWRPRALLVEATRPGTRVPNHGHWEHVVLDAGYQFATFDGLNRYYVRDEDRDLADALRIPVNIFDEYIPFEYSNQIQDLRGQLNALSRRLAAARVVNDSLRGGLGNLFAQLRVVRSHYEDLARSSAATQAQCAELRAALADSESRFETLRAAMIDVRLRTAASHGQLAELGPMGLAVGVRLTRLSRRFPLTGGLIGSTLRRAARAGRRLRSVPS